MVPQPHQDQDQAQAQDQDQDQDHSCQPPKHPLDPPSSTPPKPKKQRQAMMSRQHRGAPVDRTADKDAKAKGLDDQNRPRYRLTDQEWKMSDFPDPLLPRPDLSSRLPPGMDRETERGFYAYLQICKDKAKEADEKREKVARV
ncbi:uncharacterized protein DNG_00333 [Cephalotrichum gorgonifer]|uniref:Uncharacterized protein n=1 Tax=Cephalotrichum gorgonifer TaxID=2041049 RepID=A0AAE8SQN0_9PEZI|nr:uncharacterized protein DNG_00333 [Cephalotrichum gorgonifer]